LSIWLGLTIVSIGIFTLIVWLDESGFSDVWETLMGMLVFEALAFFLMIYVRKDLSALPPSIVSFVERVRGHNQSPIDASSNPKGEC